MFAGIDDAEIFSDPNGNDGDSNYNPEQDESQVLSDLEITNLDSHQRSILIKQIMARTAKTITQFDEDSRDELADLRSLENQANRHEVTKIIKEQERRAKKIATLHKNAQSNQYDDDSHQQNEWQEEEAHIIDEQQLMSVEIDNSQRQVDGLLHLCEESRTAQCTNLEQILQKLEHMVDDIKQHSMDDLENYTLQTSGANSVIQTKIDGMKQLVEEMRNEKIDLQYNLEKSETTLLGLNNVLNEMKQTMQEKDQKYSKTKKKLILADEKTKDLEQQLETLTETSAKQKMELAGMEAMKNASGRVADLNAQLTVQEKRAKAAITKANEFKKNLSSADTEINHLQKTVSALESRLEEEKMKTDSLTQKNQASAKGVADLGANAAQGLVDTENRLKNKFHTEIDAMKKKNIEDQVQQNIITDDLRSQVVRLKTTETELRKQMERLRATQNEAIGTSSRSQNDREMIASLKTQR